MDASMGRVKVTSGRTSEPTVCPFCACGCGLYLQTTDGELCGVMPSEHHRVSGGRLCARGWASHEASLWGRRLTTPLVRNGGAPAPASWPQALAVAVERLRAALASGRPIGVLGSGRATNEENFLAAGLARAGLRTAHVDSCLRAPYQDLLTAIAPADLPRDPRPALADIEACDVILLLEDDLALTHPQAAFAMMRAVKRGARLVTIGSLRTQLSRLAWLHLPLVPGGEAEFAAALAGDAGPAPVRQAMEAYRGASQPGLVVAPTGTAPAALQAVCAALARLAEAAGHLHRPGAVILPLPIRGNTRGAFEMGAAPDALPGPSGLDDEAAQGRLARAWGNAPAPGRGHDVERMLREVAALVIVADDPPVSLLSAASARNALASLDCLIVLDAFVTPTVEAAHVALPIASLAETDGTCTNLEGRIQRLRAGARPPGEARPGWQALVELGAALGLAWSYPSVDAVLDGIRMAVPAYGAAPARDPQDVDAWTSQRLPAVPAAAHSSPPPSSAAPHDRGDPVAPASGAPAPLQLARMGVFEWGDDPLVVSSPTLLREHASLRKRFPSGLVAMNSRDARERGVRDGWQVRLLSRVGEARVSVSLRDDVEPGFLMVPFAFRDRLEPVLGQEPRVAVELQKV